MPMLFGRFVIGAGGARSLSRGALATLGAALCTVSAGLLAVHALRAPVRAAHSTGAAAVDVEEEVRAVLARAASAERVDTEAVGEELAALGDEALPSLLLHLEQLGDAEEAARVAPCLVSALERLQPASVAAAIAQRLSADRATRQAGMLRALGRADAERALPWITEVAMGGVEDPEPLDDSVRSALERVLVDALTDAPQLLQRVGASAARLPDDLAWTYVGAVGGAELPGSLEVLGETLAERPRFVTVVVPHVRRLARRYPTLVSDALRDRIRWRFEDGGTAPERTELVLALGAVRDWDSVGALVDMLRADDPSLRRAAHSALEGMTGLGLSDRFEDAASWLSQEERWFDGDLDRLVTDLHEGNLGAITAALSEISSHRYRGGDLAMEVGALLHSESLLVRQRACHALGALGAPEAIEPLIERLGDDDDGVRAAALVALGTLTDQDLGEDAEAWRLHFGLAERP